MLLSNRVKYPYFFRTMVSAMEQNPPRLAIMREFGWNKVATLTNHNEPHTQVT